MARAGVPLRFGLCFSPNTIYVHTLCIVDYHTTYSAFTKYICYATKLGKFLAWWKLLTVNISGMGVVPALDYNTAGGTGRGRGGADVLLFQVHHITYSVRTRGRRWPAAGVPLRSGLGAVCLTYVYSRLSYDSDQTEIAQCICFATKLGEPWLRGSYRRLISAWQG